MKVEYQVFNPKVNKPLHELTRADAIDAYDWFIENIEERIAQLQILLKSSGSRVILDFSEESLEGIHDFFYEVASYERDQKRESPSPRLFSICNDVAIYLVETLLKKHSNLFWKLNLSKRTTSYQRPVVMGFAVKNKKFDYDFDLIFIQYAFRLIQGGDKEDGFFVRLYSIASDMSENTIKGGGDK